MSVALQRCSWLSKIYSDSKSRVSKVKNSRYIFTLFLPQSKGPFSKTVRESCPQIRVRLQNYQYQTPRSIGFDGEVFYNVWQEMEPPQLVVARREARFFSQGLIFEDFSTRGMKKFSYLKTTAHSEIVFLYELTKQFCAPIWRVFKKIAH